MDKQELSYHRYYDKPAASFCHQGAAWVSDMSCNFYLVKNHNIANNSTNAKAAEKNPFKLGNFLIYVWRNLNQSTFT
jgi:hypothetical protein